MLKGSTYDNLYARLETKESEKELYRLARPAVLNQWAMAH